MPVTNPFLFTLVNQEKSKIAPPCGHLLQYSSYFSHPRYRKGHQEFGGVSFLKDPSDGNSQGAQSQGTVTLKEEN
jgi:hypothetical protein